MIVLGSVLATVIVNPWLIIPVAILAVFSIYARYFFLKTSREVKRLEAISEWC